MKQENVQSAIVRLPASLPAYLQELILRNLDRRRSLQFPCGNFGRACWLCRWSSPLSRCREETLEPSEHSLRTVRAEHQPHHSAAAETPCRWRRLAGPFLPPLPTSSHLAKI